MKILGKRKKTNGWLMLRTTYYQPLPVMRVIQWEWKN